MAQEEFEPGDNVEWNTPQGKTRGTVKKKLTGIIYLTQQGWVRSMVRCSPSIGNSFGARRYSCGALLQGWTRLSVR